MVLYLNDFALQYFPLNSFTNIVIASVNASCRYSIVNSNIKKNKLTFLIKIKSNINLYKTTSHMKNFHHSIALSSFSTYFADFSY